VKLVILLVHVTFSFHQDLAPLMWQLGSFNNCLGKELIKQRSTFCNE